MWILIPLGAYLLYRWLTKPWTEADVAWISPDCSRSFDYEVDKDGKFVRFVGDE